MKRKQLAAVLTAALMIVPHMEVHAAYISGTVNTIESIEEKIHEDDSLINQYTEEGTMVYQEASGTQETPWSDVPSMISTWRLTQFEEPYKSRMDECIAKVEEAYNEKNMLYNELNSMPQEAEEINPAPVLNFEGVELQYSQSYMVTEDMLTAPKGVVNFGNHIETWYTEKMFPGDNLDIPDRHIAEDGTIRDIDGYICVASDYSFLPKGSVVMTSLGPAKVYDTGCKYGVIDIYTNW